MISGVEHEGAHYLGAHGMQPEFEGGNHAEVAAPAADGPEKVRVLLLAGPQQTPVGGDHLHGEEVVGGEAVLAPQVTHAAVEREPGDAGLGDDAHRRRQTVLLRLLVELAYG